MAIRGELLLGFGIFLSLFGVYLQSMYPTTNGGHIKINKNVYDSGFSRYF